MVVGDSLESWHLPTELRWMKGVFKKCKPPDAFEEEKIVWSEEHADVFTREQSSENFIEQINTAYGVLNTDIDGCVDIFVKAMFSAAACMVRKTGRRKKARNEWFDDECGQKKKKS